MSRAEFTKPRFEWTSFRKVGKLTLHQLVVGELAQPIFLLLVFENKKMRILIQGSLAAQQICFPGTRNALADRGTQPHFSI